MKKPVNIVTGFLGAGKSTFINSLLKIPAMNRTAVIVNEFGDVGIDQMIIDQSNDDVIELSGGCLCCAVRGAFVTGLVDLLSERGSEIDRILIETSGLADPLPVLQAMMTHWQLSQLVSTGSVLCLVDGQSDFSALLNYPEAQAQLALADQIFITKSTEFPSTQNLSSKIASNIEPKLEPFDFACVAATLCQPGTHSQFKAITPPKRGAHGANYRTSILDTTKPISRINLERFLELLVAKFSANLLRVKGLVLIAEHEKQPLLLQAAGSIFSEPAILENWADEHPKTQIVVITTHIGANEIEPIFNAALGVQSLDAADATATFNNPLSLGNN